jgi:uncharacterized protein involved in exopolysaccharide biosynthesis
MAEKQQGNFDFNSINFVWFIWKWKWILGTITLIAAIAAAIFSGPYFITPMFKSVVVLFPTATNSISKTLMNETPGDKEDLMAFGEETESEQLLQILNSSEIRDKIVSRFDLMHHYKIKPKSKFAVTRLNKEYNSNITFRRTEFKAVEIKVMDRSADTAMLIANTISDYLDTMKNAIQKQRALDGLAIVEEEYKQVENEIYQSEDSLRKLREKGVHDYETQAEMINQQLAIEIAHRNAAGIKALNDKLDTLAKYGGAYVSIRDALEHDKKNFSELKRSYRKAKVDAEAFVPQKFVVDKAYKAEKKSYPVRWLIVVVSAFSAFLLTIIILIILENIAGFRSASGQKVSGTVE